MSRGWLIAIGALCALPVQGNNLDQSLSPAEIHALTPIDSAPTSNSLDIVLQAPDVSQRIVRLREIALSPNVDFGVRLRAIRALPQYCTPNDCRSDGVQTGDAAHLSVRRVFDSIEPTDHSGQGILRLRATIEALGATRSALSQDVALIVPYLAFSSRDVRVAAARALRDLCNVQAMIPLRARYQQEQVPQVRFAISMALRDLGQCH